MSGSSIPDLFPSASVANLSITLAPKVLNSWYISGITGPYCQRANASLNNNEL